MAKTSTKPRNIIIATILIIAVVSVSFILLFEPSLVGLPTTRHYGDKVGASGSNLVGFDLTTYNPVNWGVYSNRMPLHFKIDWNYGLLFYDNAKQYGLYSYKIDNDPPVNLPSNQKTNSSNDFIAHPSFSSNIDISNLANGQYQLVIIAVMEWNPFGIDPEPVCNQTTIPILFTVQNPS